MTRKLTPPAPLGRDTNLGMPTVDALEDEMLLVAAELKNALTKHRGYWLEMQRLKLHFTQRNIDFLDNEREWKEATGNVTWWRGEVSAAANSLQALTGLASYLRDHPGPRSQGQAWEHPYNQAGASPGSPLESIGLRAAMDPQRPRRAPEATPDGESQSARSVVFSWDPSGLEPPTEAQARAARAWLDVADGARLSKGDRTQLGKLIEAWMYARR